MALYFKQPKAEHSATTSCFTFFACRNDKKLKQLWQQHTGHTGCEHTSECCYVCMCAFNACRNHINNSTEAKASWKHDCWASFDSVAAHTSYTTEVPVGSTDMHPDCSRMWQLHIHFFFLFIDMLWEFTKCVLAAWQFLHYMFFQAILVACPVN